MSMQAMTTIARREIRETLTDWRILLPISLLTLLMPQLMVRGTSVVVNFVDLEGLQIRLIPFIILVVGFIPSSFSLITALEAFVGERERNSLEALLSMPVSDDILYISKFCSSLLTPLISGWLAMIVYLVMLYVSNLALYTSAINIPQVSLLFLLISLMSTTMVAAAVVISSHISSVRAANLMSSFILIGMAVAIQVEAFMIINERWDLLLVTTLVFAIISIVLVRAGMATFNREEILAREHRSFSFSRFWTIIGLGRYADVTSTSLPEESATLNDQATSVPAGHVPHVQTMLTVARRELRDTLTDWRTLLPVTILTLVIPVVLISGTDTAVDFVDDPLVIGRLVPFAILLIGFIPSSFSLITALDSFVGERERSSLEALLAMPMTDHELYTSKLGASLLVPLFSGLGAMLFFAALLASIYPELYFHVMTGVRLVQLLLMIGIITLTMVAGAVVISSHTSSIRAATLLSSFILLPTTALLQIQSVFIIAQRWDVLWMIIISLTIISLALIRTGMATFNREEILSREHIRFDLNQIFQTFATFFREYQPAGVVPAMYQGLGFDPRRFYRHELPALLRELRTPISIALVLAVVGVLSGGVIGNLYRMELLRDYLNQIGTTTDPSLQHVWHILAQNLRVSFFTSILSLFSFGMFACMLPVVNFMQIGFVVSTLHSSGGNWFAFDAESPTQFLLAHIVPHGIIELPMLILCAALGIRVGLSLLSTISGFSVGQNILWSLATFWKVWLLVLVPGFLLAALIEGLIVPQIVRALY